jgi:TatD DNase family protein
MALIDTHAHLYLEHFDQDLEEVLHKSRAAGVDLIAMPNIDSSTTDAMLRISEYYPDYCIPMMGLHPCSVKEDFNRELEHVQYHLDQGSFAAVGEIGIDLYWDKTFYTQQVEAFSIQVRWALKRDLPIVIHCRESLDETISLVHDLHDGHLKGIFHCFTGDQGQAEKIIDMGFLLGIGGVSTFKNGGLDKVIPHIDLDHLVLETDSPYLAPAPFRGKRNEPSLLPHIARQVAMLKNCTQAEIEAVTTENARRIFKI